MRHGHLLIRTPEREYTFPNVEDDKVTNGHDDLHASLRILNKSFWIRLALMSDLGFAEVCPWGLQFSDTNFKPSVL